MNITPTGDAVDVRITLENGTTHYYDEVEAAFPSKDDPKFLQINSKKGFHLIKLDNMLSLDVFAKKKEPEVSNP
jgi:hypothetical protein